MRRHFLIDSMFCVLLPRRELGELANEKCRGRGGLCAVCRCPSTIVSLELSTFEILPSDLSNSPHHYFLPTEISDETIFALPLTPTFRLGGLTEGRLLKPNYKTY